MLNPLDLLLGAREWQKYTAVLWSIGCHYGTAYINSKDFPADGKTFQRVRRDLIAMRDKYGIYFKIVVDRKCYV